MIKSIRTGLFLCLFISGLGYGSTEFVRIERLTDRVVIAYWLGTGRTNLVAIKSQKGLVIIDTEMSPRIMAPMKERLERSLGRNDWKYVINTHAHMHHAGGNCLFENAVVVGHDNLPADMQWLIDQQANETRKKQKLDYNAETISGLKGLLPRVKGNRLMTRRIQGEIRFYELNTQDIEECYEIIKPTVTFSDKHTIDMGDLRLELVYIGKGHSYSDILIYIPQEGVLITGAIVYQRGHLPGINDKAELEDIRRYIAVLNEFLKDGVNIKHVVASHGSVVTRKDLEYVRDYYQAMLDGIAAAQAEGLTLEQAKEQFDVKKKFPHYFQRQNAEWVNAKQNHNIDVLWQLLKDANQQPQTYDVVIYGSTSAAVSAAVQVKRMERTVAIVCPDTHLGGLSSGGLGWTDSGRKEAIGGISREFYSRIKKHYDNPEVWTFQKPEDYSRYRPEDDAMWVFEPHVAEQVFEEFVKEHNIPVYRNEWLNRKDGVQKDGTQIKSITMLSGRTYNGSIFIDATYEGDLMAAAGVSYHVGRESNEKYGETLNGVQTRNAVSHQFEKPVDPYINPGDPDSGLLSRIHGDGPGKEGQGDKCIQAYNFRMCLTQAAANRIPFPKPDNYDSMQYELLARYLDQGWRDIFNKFDPAPNNKTDTNNHGAFSTDNIGMNYDYPEADYQRRKEIIKEHEDYQKGLMWFLAYDARVPADVREKMNQWGLSKDEFKDNSHWPHQIYVREARRMVSDFAITELHLRRIKPTPKPIGMGSYNMDSHNVQRYVDNDGHARNEGDIQINPGGPYPISYDAIVPISDQCTNLLVPVCVSSSHIAYGSIRMEPVFMILGQSAAAAAILSIENDTNVQDVDYSELRIQLLADGQILELR